jgi:REP element-mobilizing transposase RayT/DNA-binding transcriptional ArsR family regulator
MPRKSRIDAPGALHHIICRGIERRPIFEDDLDRDRFVERLGSVLRQTATPCYAWALIPNHFHLLIRTGLIPVATVMRRLLTGYAVSFNYRHRRSGHLFQNRYKSILCQADPYLLELVRYIHLNAIRAGLVADMKSLDRYPYSGHSRLTGKFEGGFQDIQTVLSMFAKTLREAKRRYKAFVSKGVLAGKRPELTGGGLLRSSGGWHALKQLRSLSVHFKSDERVLGDSDFVDTVLKAAGEKMDRKYRLQAEGYDFEDVLSRVCELFRLTRREVLSWSKQRNRAMARSVLAYWSVKELGMTAFAVAERLGLSPSAASRCVQRGERIVAGDELVL